MLGERTGKSLLGISEVLLIGFSLPTAGRSLLAVVKGHQLYIFLAFGPSLLLGVDSSSREDGLLCQSIYLVVEQSWRTLHLDALRLKLTKLVFVGIFCCCKLRCVLFRVFVVAEAVGQSLLLRDVFLHDFWLAKAVQKRVLTTYRGLLRLKMGLLCVQSSSSLPCSFMFNSSGNLKRACLCFTRLTCGTAWFLVVAAILSLNLGMLISLRFSPLPMLSLNSFKANFL